MNEYKDSLETKLIHSSRNALAEDNTGAVNVPIYISSSYHQAAAKAFVEHIRIPVFAVSLGAVESILSYPATMSHAAMPKNERDKRGITDGLLRLSVGLEHIEDLINDLDQALRVAEKQSDVHRVIS